MQFEGGVTVADNEALETLFTYQPPKTGVDGELQKAAYERLRTAAKVFAYTIHTTLQPGPDRTAAIRKVREAVMTANASLATDNTSYS